MSARILVRRLSAAPAERKSWQAVREICCRTGDNGNPVAAERREFFARVWIEPYEKLLPEWVYVAERDGIVAGYLTGCPDTAKFERAKRRRITLPLLLAVALGRYRGVAGAGDFARRALGAGRDAMDSFGSAVRRSLERDYPAHLHINVDAPWRAAGMGRRLIERFQTDLQSSGCSGIHLCCGPDPVGFYAKLGFHELSRVEARGGPVFLMVKRC